MGVLRPESLRAAQAAGQDDWPGELVERPLRDGFPAPLPLNADGSAPEHPASAAGPISDPLMWRTQGRQTPEIEFDYREMQIKVDTRGLATRTGTLHFSDLEQLPSVSHTFLLQCGAPNPRGIVKWTGVRFSDFADMLGLIPEAHYVRFIASDRFSSGLWASASGRTVCGRPTMFRRNAALSSWVMTINPSDTAAPTPAE